MRVPFTHAARSLSRSPGFTVAAVLTLAIGIGATASIFTVLNTILFNPLPYPEAGRLVGAWHALPGMGFDRAPQSLATYFTYKRYAHSIQGIAVWNLAPANLTDATGSSAAERIPATLTTASLFPVLGIQPALGRSFTADEDAPHGAPVVVISDGLWRRRFGHDPAIIGKKLQLNGMRRTVIGVMPADFHFPDAQTEIWLPLALDPTGSGFGGAFGYFGLVRLRPGVTLDAAQREMNALLPRVIELFPSLGPGTPTASFFAQAAIRVTLYPFRDDIVGSFTRQLWIAAAAGAILLLIACANVASLLLTRAEARQRELAVRAALGAGSGRLLGQFLSEASVLAGIGGALGLAIAAGGVAAFVRLGPPGIPRLVEVKIDHTVVAFTALITVAVALLCSVIPALRFAPQRMTAMLRDGGRGGTTGRERQRARRALVIAQVAFAMVLVGSATLLLRSFEHLRGVRPGFDPSHTLTLWLSLPKESYATDSSAAQFTTRVINGVRALPGVSAVGITSKLPLNRNGSAYTPVWPDAGPHATEKLPPSEQLVTATSDYFAAMRIPLVAGQMFVPAGRENPYNVVISRSLAQLYWGDSTGVHALGRQLHLVANGGGPAYTVIGVVGSVHDTSLAAPATGLIYMDNVPAPDTNFSAVTRMFALAVRTTGDPQTFALPVQQVLRGLDPALPTFAVRPMGEIVADSTARLSFLMLLLGVAAAVALALAAVGLYGVVAYLVSMRTREIGVRIALGALPGNVARLVTGQGSVLAAIGVIIGSVAFVAAARVLRTLLFDVDTYDPLTIVGVSVVLMVVALAASWIPARRATRIDPVRALGADA